jgi:UV DNA damage endonuclease
LHPLMSFPPYRLGFAVKILGAGGLKTSDTRRWQSGPHLRVSLGLLDAAFDHLDAIDVRVFRLSSSTVPYGTHPDLPQLDYRRQIDECGDELDALGAKARRLGLRLSTHPGQYTVLDAPDATLRAKSALDLEQDALLLDALGQPPEASVVVHVGGAYGDREAALARWATEYERLSERAQRRVVVEHDETSFTLADVLRLHERTGVKVVYDLHHDRCNPSPGLGLADAYATWPAGVRPKAHLSSPRTELRTVGKGKAARLVPPLLDQHADFATPWDLRDLLAAAPGPLDVVVEAKAKDLAVLWLRRQLERVAQEVAAAEIRSLDRSLTRTGSGTFGRTRSKEHSMAGIAKYVTVDAPVEKVYEYWRDFTNFPHFMPHVQEVTPVSGDDELTHWKVDGPVGVDAEWDARIVEDVPNEKIAWASVEGSRVENSGVVRFEGENGRTNVEVALEYDPPGGTAGELVARMFENPEQQVEESLERFKQLVGGWS